MMALRSRRVVTPEGVRPAAVLVRGGRIEAVVEPSAAPAGALDLGDDAVLPGIVDTHAHVNEPGRTEWEGFETATRAAAAGGITTLVDMPLNSIPATTTADALEAKRRSADGRCAVDYGFWGGVVPGNLPELPRLVERGALGFKAFLVESGVDEFPMVREPELRAAMREHARLGRPLLVHAELASGAARPGPWKRYADYLASRPKAWEDEAVRLVIRLVRETGCRAHVVHLSSADAVEDLAAAKREGLPVSAETCPHYLALCAEDVPEGATHFKCAPPIRERENCERLWEALRRGDIELVVSDHSPCAPELKRLEEGDFARAWGGIAGLQFSLPVVWTEASARGFTLADVARLMAEAPARLAGLRRKGRIAPGMDADLVVFDPEAEFTPRQDQVLHRHKLTPYAGRRLLGLVKRTLLRGEPAAPGRGRELSKEAAAC